MKDGTSRNGCSLIENQLYCKGKMPTKTDSPSATYELIPFEGERQFYHGLTRGELTAIQPEQVA